MSMCVSRIPPSRIATRAPAPVLPAFHAAGADIASGTHCARRNVSAAPTAVAGLTDTSSVPPSTSITRSGFNHCTSISASAHSAPAILAARVANVGSFELATATPIRSKRDVTAPPAPLTCASRSAGREPEKLMMYDLTALDEAGAWREKLGAAAVDGRFGVFAVGVIGAS